VYTTFFLKIDIKTKTQKGDLAEARRVCERALNIDPTFQAAQSMLEQLKQ
jgi:hypothetical protein